MTAGEHCVPDVGECPCRDCRHDRARDAASTPPFVRPGSTCLVRSGGGAEGAGDDNDSREVSRIKRSLARGLDRTGR
jgi:hypothetical protein